MTLLASNGFKVAVAALAKAMLDGGEIRVFSGSRPTSVEAAETGTLLGTIRRDTGGTLTYVSDGPYLLKPTTAVWELTAIADGNPSWFRIVRSPSSTHGVSYTEVRFDGDVSANPATNPEMTILSAAVVDGNTYPVDSFLYTIPPIIGA